MENLNSSLEDINDVTKKLTVSIPAIHVSKEFESAIQELSRTARIKGFREGKAPKEMVEKLHGSRVRLEVANKLISSTLEGVLKERELDIIGQPEIDIASFDPGKDIEFTAVVSLFPSPKIDSYDAFEVEVPESEVTDEDLDKVLQAYRESKASIKKNEFRTEAKMGDVIDATLKVSFEGSEEGGSEPLVVCLGEANLPKELQDGIIGMETGTAKSIVVSGEENHPNPELQGKEMTYEVTLNTISDKVLPELDDDFAKSLDMGSETLLELRIKVRENLEERAKGELDRQTRNLIVQELVKKNQFDVPGPLVDHEIRNILIQTGALDPQKVDPRQIDVAPFRDKLADSATERVRGMIAIDRIGAQEKIEVADADLQDYLAKAAEANQVSLAEVLKVYTPGSERERGLRSDMVHEKVLDMLVERTKVKKAKKKPEAEEKGTEKSKPKAKKKAAAKTKKTTEEKKSDS